MYFIHCQTITYFAISLCCRSCVSFGPKTRVMGDAAKQQANTNLNNTIINFKHLIGRKFTDSRTQQIRQWIPCEMVQLAGDNIGLKVRLVYQFISIANLTY